MDLFLSHDMMANASIIAGNIIIPFFIFIFVLVSDSDPVMILLQDSLGIPYLNFLISAINGCLEAELKENIGGDTLRFYDAGFFVTDIIEQEVPAVDVIIVLPVQQVYDG